MRRYALVITLGTLALGLSARPTLRADSALYKIDDLGTTADGLIPYITGINSSGQVAGYVVTANGTSRAVRYTDGTGWAYLPGLQTADNIAYGINDSGDLTGYRQTSAGQRAFRYRDGTGVEDITPLAQTSFSVGMAMNANGDVVGYDMSTAGAFRGWRASPGLPAVQLPDLGSGFTMTCGVNDAGQVTGMSMTAQGYFHAFRIDADNTVVDAGSFDGPAGTSMSCAIDQEGRIAGTASAQNGAVSHAFRFLSTLQDINGALPGVQSNVESLAGGNAAGEYVLANGDTRAFVYTDANGAVDLNTQIPAGSGWVLTDIKGINSKGQMAGDGQLNGKPRAFRLSLAVVPDTTPPVISSLSANPSVIAPPNGAMVPVTVSVSATDNKDPNPSCAISSIDGHGLPSSYFSITGALTGSVKADPPATYTFTVTCSDASGNNSSSAVDVVVAPDTTPPVISKVTATPSTISPANLGTASVTVAIEATDDSGQTPVCKLGYITGPGSAPADFNVTGALTGTVKAVAGRTYVFNVLCVDPWNNVSWSSTNVVVPPDVTAPVISSVTATPSTIWPPKGQTVSVSISVAATDDSTVAPTCSLASISGPGTAGADYAVTGTFTGTVKAVGGRTYTFTAACADYSGNTSTATANVVVPPDTTPPTITSVSVTPSVIWPPDGRMVPIAVSVTAVDDVDDAPVCTVTSISPPGMPSGDAVVTGQFTGAVRAIKNADSSARIYSVLVTCSDFSGNRSTGTVTVTVPHDASSSTSPSKPSTR